jgi:hypothetical protein
VAALSKSSYVPSASWHGSIGDATSACGTSDVHTIVESIQYLRDGLVGATT